MKQLTLFAIAIAVVSAVRAATIGQVIVRQQWPWSTDIKIEYTLSNVTVPVDLTVKAYNGSTELNLSAAAISGDRFGLSEDCVGTLTIDPVVAFGSGRVALPNFKVKLVVTDSAADIHETLFKIFNLTNGVVQNVSRADIMNDKSYGPYVTKYEDIHTGFTTGLSNVFIWTGVTNNLSYKTTHLVMRRISAKDATYLFGSASSKCTVELTNDYYIGVFKLTNEQWKNILGYYSGSYTDKSHYPDMETMPVLGVRWDYFAGFSSECDWSKVPVTPSANVNFVLGKLRSVFPGCAFHLPSEAQWEFAARAGTSDDIHGARVSSLVAWANGSGTVPITVGSLLPNAFGLYDVIGNGSEWCRDWQDVIDLTTERTVTEPEGASQAASQVAYPSSGQRVCRGNRQTDKVNWLSVYGRSGLKPTGSDPGIGARLWCAAQ